jgi:hypothetical protein
MSSAKNLIIEYQTVFPEREGALLRPDIDDILSEPWFYFSDFIRFCELEYSSFCHPN